MLRTDDDMENEDIPEIPFVRGEFLEKVNRLSYYIKARAFIATLDERIKSLEDELEMPLEENTWSRSEKEKQVQISHQKRQRLASMEKNRERMMDRLTEMEKQIRVDIDSEK